MAHVDDALAELARYLDDDGVFADASGAEPHRDDVPVSTRAEPWTVLLLHAARSVTRSAAYRLHWRWRRLRRFGRRLREEYRDLKQIETAARRDQSQHTADHRARSTGARPAFD
jgi:hypothetical protein